MKDELTGTIQGIIDSLNGDGIIFLPLGVYSISGINLPLGVYVYAIDDLMIIKNNTIKESNAGGIMMGTGTDKHGNYVPLGMCIKNNKFI